MHYFLFFYANLSLCVPSVRADFGCDRTKDVVYIVYMARPSYGQDTVVLASQARLFRAVAELTARESHEEEELLPELLQREKSLVAFENVIVTWDPRSGFIA